MAYVNSYCKHCNTEVVAKLIAKTSYKVSTKLELAWFRL